MPTIEVNGGVHVPHRASEQGSFRLEVEFQRATSRKFNEHRLADGHIVNEIRKEVQRREALPLYKRVSESSRFVGKKLQLTNHQDWEDYSLHKERRRLYCTGCYPITLDLRHYAGLNPLKNEQATFRARDQDTDPFEAHRRDHHTPTRQIVRTNVSTLRQSHPEYKNIFLEWTPDMLESLKYWSTKFFTPRHSNLQLPQ